MTKEEILQLNIIRTEGKNEFIFEDEGKLYPTKIIVNSPTYGKYKLTAFVYIDVMIRDERVMQANTECRKMSGSLSTYVLEEVSISGRQAVKFVIYLCDLDDNKDWFENNKNNPDCKILKEFPEYEKIGLPVGVKGLKNKFKDFYRKYPMTELQ